MTVYFFGPMIVGLVVTIIVMAVRGAIERHAHGAVPSSAAGVRP